ncbi:MAG: lipocalin family protein [Candidatus Cloacimonetes bacterium]|nr:lipocalin family protein [Candidatus Cloacimonadota bacterium]
MNNSRLVLVVVLCMALFPILSVSCSKDNSPTGPGHDLALVGFWKLTLMSSEDQGETVTYTEAQLDSMGVVWTYEIEDDGTIEQITNISGPLISMPGTWSTSSNQLTLILTDPSGEPGTLVYEYEIDGDILKLEWELTSGTKYYAEFTKQW